MLIVKGIIGGKQYDDATVSPKELAKLLGVKIPPVLHLRIPSEQVRNIDEHNTAAFPDNIRIVNVTTGVFDGESVTITIAQTKTPTNKGVVYRYGVTNRLEIKLARNGVPRAEIESEFEAERVVFLLLHTANKASVLRNPQTPTVPVYEQYDPEAEKSAMQQQVIDNANILTSILANQDVNDARRLTYVMGLNERGRNIEGIMDAKGNPINTAVTSAIITLAQTDPAYVRETWTDREVFALGQIALAFHAEKLRVVNSMGGASAVHNSKTQQPIVDIKPGEKPSFAVLRYMDELKPEVAELFAKEILGDTPAKAGNTKNMQQIKSASETPTGVTPEQKAMIVRLADKKLLRYDTESGTLKGLSADGQMVFTGIKIKPKSKDTWPVEDAERIFTELSKKPLWNSLKSKLEELEAAQE